MPLLSIPLALLGAMLFAASAALQQHSLRSTARRPAVGVGGLAPPPGPRLLIRVAREPLWWLGWLAGIAGFGAQAVALQLGSIVVVQALVVTQLLFALPFGSAFTGRRLLRRDWWGAAAVCAGLILLVTVRAGVPQTAGRRSEIPLVVAVAAGSVSLLFLTACLLRSHTRSRTVAFAAGAGICFCMTAVFLVFAGDGLARRGLLAAALGRPSAGLVASTVVGMVLVQNAFAEGSLPTALTTMNITDPLASGVVGMVVFDARPAVGPGMLWAMAGSIVLIAAGVTLLASSPAPYDRRLARGRAPGIGG